MPRQKEDRERERLRQQHAGEVDWYRWGPYLSERAWGTVREDYSAKGDAWDHFPFDHAHARAYRWSEDGLGAISDIEQRLCFSLGLWNGRDSIIKERAFGLTNSQGNRGEEVKEYYFYQDATPTHSWMRYLYRYPQAAFPYSELIRRNAKLDRSEPGVGLIDTGVFEKGYWDVQISYAKKTADQLFIRIAATNRGPKKAVLHLLPTLWLRNTWSWSGQSPTSSINLGAAQDREVAWCVSVKDQKLHGMQFAGRQQAELLFTDNESNSKLLWDEPGPQYAKDAFNRYLIKHEKEAVRDKHGTRFAALRRIEAMPGETEYFDLWLGSEMPDAPFATLEKTLTERLAEADCFYDALQPRATTEDHRILRQVMAGMTWGKQYYHYDVKRWLDGDKLKPPEQRQGGRNSNWRHLHSSDIISMPDVWEYPWFAAWDLAYQCAPLALTDMGFAKQQIEVLLGERFLHPTGAIPSYEWNFSDTNPPVHAAFALRVFRADRMRNGVADYSFLRRVFHKLLLNYAWWLNRKDVDGHNLFNGGFLGLDNISVFDRSKSPLPAGFHLVQADATGWMANYALNMTVIALEIAAVQPDFESIAIQCYEQFLSIAESIAGHDQRGLTLWDDSDGFFKDIVAGPDGKPYSIDVYSWVGLIPLFACEVVGPALLQSVPRFAELLKSNDGGQRHGHFQIDHPSQANQRGEHLLSLVSSEMLTRIMERVLDEEQFLCRFGIRSLSRVHGDGKPVGNIPGIGDVFIDYVPGEANSPMYGGNSNWRGPVWLPTNYSLIIALERYYRYLGPEYTLRKPGTDSRVTLKQAADLIANRIVDLYRRGEDDRIPALRPDSPFQNDPHWKNDLLFYEYFHAETGRGLGAAHQTGWTGLLANLIMRKYR